MPTYIVTCKKDASEEEIAQVKEHAKDEGGEITHEYKIIKGFAVKFPEGTVTALDSHEHVLHFEEDAEMTTQ